ncbi:hypothetical protein TWF506_004253 [Arthrobotrys conoides]|uniref:Uncharacterized protein n=1 Tax=Arthrobotrys conoides TaxID=74498 RepID=A0AAN8RIF3_9PEZI
MFAKARVLNSCSESYREWKNGVSGRTTNATLLSSLLYSAELLIFWCFYSGLGTRLRRPLSFVYAYPDIDSECIHISDILAIPSLAVIATALGERHQMIWERSFMEVFPEMDVQRVFADDCQKLPIETRALLKDCWNCKLRRSFDPLYTFSETQGRVIHWPYLPINRSLMDLRVKEFWLCLGLKLCSRCDFGDLEYLRCGETPLGLQGQDLSVSTQGEEDQLPTTDPTTQPIPSDAQIKGLSAQLSAWPGFYLRHLGPTGILIIVLSVAVSYLLYKLNRSENLRHSMLVHNEGLGSQE